MGLEVQAAPEGLIRLEHTEIHLDKPTYCAWGLKNPGRCVAGVGPDSAFSAADVIITSHFPLEVSSLSFLRLQIISLLSILNTGLEKSSTTPGMSPRKRRASDYSGQPAAKSARTKTTYSRLDQVKVST